MFGQLFPISALLLGSGLLMFAGGMHGLLLPVRGALEGFSSSSLGLLGTSWAVGHVLGCLLAPRLVASVGHIRTFGAMCAFAAVAMLLQALLVHVWVWIAVRAISGFCFASAAMIVESWLSEKSTPTTRGTIFGVYGMVNLGALTMGQMAIALGDPSGFAFFAIGAIFYCLALAPTALSTSGTPTPLTTVKLDIRALWHNSPVSVAVVFLTGISNAAFSTLAAVYADGIGLTLTAVALFASIPVMAGAVSQVPMGVLSDSMDRRIVLVGVGILAVAADLAFILIAPQEQWGNLVLVAIFGAAMFAIYPILVAHANDNAPAGTSIQVSGGLLLLYGLGCIVGPLLGGFAMSAAGPGGLFMTTIVAHVLLIAFTLWRMSKRAAAPAGEKGTFQPIMSARNATPETVAFEYGEREGVQLKT